MDYELNWRRFYPDKHFCTFLYTTSILSYFLSHVYCFEKKYDIGKSGKAIASGFVSPLREHATDFWKVLLSMLPFQGWQAACQESPDRDYRSLSMPSAAAERQQAFPYAVCLRDGKTALQTAGR